MPQFDEVTKLTDLVMQVDAGGPWGPAIDAIADSSAGDGDARVQVTAAVALPKTGL